MNRKGVPEMFAVVLVVLVFAAQPSVAGAADTGTIFDQSGGNKPGTIDTEVDTTPTEVPPVSDSTVETSTGTASGYDVGTSTGTTKDSGKKTGKETTKK
jgi:hypothetical protein